MSPYIPEQDINTGSFIPTSYLWDIGRLFEIDVNSTEFKELLVRLYQNVNNVSLVLSSKDTAYYLTQEFNSSQLYFNPVSNTQIDLRPGFRILINIGALGAGITNTNHNLAVTSSWKFVKISGAASNTGTLTYYPLPFAGAAGNNIEVNVTATQVVINNASGTIFTDAYVVLEYVKS